MAGYDTNLDTTDQDRYTSKALNVSLCFIIFLLLATSVNAVAYSTLVKQSGQPVACLQDCSLGSDPCAPERIWCAIQEKLAGYREA